MALRKIMYLNFDQAEKLFSPKNKQFIETHQNGRQYRRIRDFNLFKGRTNKFFVLKDHYSNNIAILYKKYTKIIVKNYIKHWRDRETLEEFFYVSMTFPSRGAVEHIVPKFSYFTQNIYTEKIFRINKSKIFSHKPEPKLVINGPLKSAFETMLKEAYTKFRAREKLGLFQNIDVRHPDFTTIYNNARKAVENRLTIPVTSERMEFELITDLDEENLDTYKAVIRLLAWQMSTSAQNAQSNSKYSDALKSLIKRRQSDWKKLLGIYSYE